MARPEREIHQSIWELLKNLRGLDPLKQVFWSQLNYQRVNEPLPRRGWGQHAIEAMAEDPVLFATGGSDTAFHVIYARLDSPELRLGMERPVVTKLLQDHPYSLFVFSNRDQDHWHFVNVKLGEDHLKRKLFRRITVGPLERLRTASERVAMLDLASISPNLFGISALEIQNRHDQAFDVESVTKEFYKEYKDVFNLLRDDLTKQTRDKHWAHDYALQFLNRCMFLYFVQRKRWLGDDPDFLASFWNGYASAGQPQDSFFPKWLSILFFEAFNDKFHGGHKHFPDTIRDALQMAPFLNGGLFAENDLDRQHDFNVTDVRFKQIFTFLERYNFTISEDSPLDQEVAVDPVMLGQMYESLVNVSEEADERGDAGIFYTPRTEIDLMCRLALVDNLANHLGNQHKNLLYEAVFVIQEDEKQCADVGLARAKLWPALDEHLQRLTVVDPACGSGSFLVGMLHILDDLRARAARQIKRDETAYDRKKGIIGRSLYGVDVMEWACHVAELRLWLALIIDVEMTREELHTRREPLLPYFSFKIRCGDSLVQEVGGITLSHRRGNMDIHKAVKDRLRKLQNAKLDFYNNESVKGMETETAIKNEEVSIFRDLLAYRAVDLEKEAKVLMRQQAAADAGNHLLETEVARDERKASMEKQADIESQIKAKVEEVAALKKQQSALRHPKDVPLVWDIAFAEVMESDVGGFDIVVGNPPYVRTQSIAAPIVNGRQVTEDKKEYKAMLARSVYQAWPTFFGYKANTDTAGRKINAKSDLYIYFYFHGLSLLNPKGSFIFITSNSWLDVGYGADLQEFLLRHGHVKMVIDNQVKRSFEADVNTVIALLARPEERREDGLARTARFIMFKAPFEQVLSPILFEEIEDARDRKSATEYRICCLSQDKLLKDGCDLPEEDYITQEESQDRKTPRTHGPLIKIGRYLGDKWGGKYLRAPDIYHAILARGRDQFVLLKEISEVNEGRPTGANDFFYPTKQVAREFGIESRFLHPGLMKARGANHFELRTEHLNRFFLSVECPKKDLRGTNVLKYIRYGEEQGLNHRNTFANKRDWYSFSVRRPADLVMPCGIGGTFFCAVNRAHAVASNSFTELRLAHSKQDAAAIWVWLNSAVGWLYGELMGRATLGGGLLKIDPFDYRRMPLLDGKRLPSKVPTLDRQVGEITEEIQARDRQVLDELVFDALKLSKGERDAVYEAVLNLVEARLKKAESV